MNKKKPALLVKKFSVYFVRFTKNDKLGLCPQTYHFSTFNLLYKLRNFFQCRVILSFNYTYFIKNIAIPITEITAPNISLNFTFSLKTKTEIGIIITGLIEEIVEATPVFILLKAATRKVIPKVETTVPA